jgi:hypothetical protein
MDVIDEDRASLGDLADFGSTQQNGGVGGFGNTAVASSPTNEDETSQVSNSESTMSDIDEDDQVDFATRLKHHRKELMDGKGRPPKKKEDFSQKLRKHRDGLINAWEIEDHANDVNSHDENDVDHRELTPTYANGDSGAPNGEFGDFYGETTVSSASSPSTADYQSAKEEDNEGRGTDLGDAGVPSSDSQFSTTRLSENDMEDPLASLSTAAPAITEPQLMMMQGGDEFNFFDVESSSLPLGEVAAPVVESSTPALGGSDDMCDNYFESTENVTSQQQSEQATLESMFEGFEDTTAAIAQQGLQTLATPVGDDVNYFGGLGVTTSEQDISMQHNVVSFCDDEGDLGDIDAPSLDRQPDDTCVSDYHDDFGDFAVSPTVPLKEDEPGKAHDDFVGGASEQHPYSNGTQNHAVDDADGRDDTLPMALTQLTPSAEFGDLGEISSKQPPSLDEQDVGNGHELGSFGEEPPLNEAHMGANHKSEQDDDFGDFRDTRESGLEPHGLPEVGDDHGEYFEDNGEATASESLVPSSLAKTDGGDFGDFGGALSSSLPNDATSDDDDFGDFADAVSNESTELTGAEQVDDDEFGDPQSEQPVTETQGSDVDFGDFGDAVEKLSGSLDAEQTEQVDFGDLGEAPSAPLVGDSVAKDVGESNGSPTTEPHQSIADDDDFGDFGDFGSSPSLPVTNQTPDDVADSVAKDDNGDDFGDFGEAPIEQPTESSRKEQHQPIEDYDEFGDFGDFGSSPAVSATNQTPDDVAESVATNDGADDFGDFGEAPIEQPNGSPTTAPQQKISDDDDFGDFGDFGSSPAAPPSNHTQDDDFGDFGGTDGEKPESGFQVEQPQSSDDFENFASAPTPPTPSAVPTLDNGPQYQRAKLVFAKIYGQYARELCGDDNDTEDGVASATLSSFLVSWTNHWVCDFGDNAPAAFLPFICRPLSNV